MKKYYLSFLIVLLFVFGFNLSKAEETTTISENKDLKVSAIKSEIKDTREAMKEKIEEMREEARLKMEGLKKEIALEKDSAKAKIKEKRIQGREESLKRFDKTVQMITLNKERLSAQITKVKALGVDTKEAEANLKVVEDKLIQVKAKTAEALSILAGTTNELTKENKEKLRVITQDTQKLINESHSLIVKTIKLLKDGVKSKYMKKTDETKNTISDISTTKSQNE